MTVEPDGSISGMTEIYFSKFIKKMLAQNLTTVRREDRGRKLGKWLKASLLLHAKTRYPNHIGIITANAIINAPMLAINNKLGYKPTNQYVHWQISLTELEEYLNQNYNYIQSKKIQLILK